MIAHADYLACAGGGECVGVVWGRAVPDRCGGPQLLLAGGDGSRRATKCGAHRSVGAGQILRAARGLHSGGARSASAIWRCWLCPGSAFSLGFGCYLGVGVCGRVLAAAQIGGAEPATVLHHDFHRGSHGVGSAIRDVAWGVANGQLAGAHRGFGAPGNLGSWTSGRAFLRIRQTELVIGLVGWMRCTPAVG